MGELVDAGRIHDFESLGHKGAFKWVDPRGQRGGGVPLNWGPYHCGACRKTICFQVPTEGRPHSSRWGTAVFPGKRGRVEPWRWAWKKDKCVPYDWRAVKEGQHLPTTRMARWAWASGEMEMLRDKFGVSEEEARARGWDKLGDHPAGWQALNVVERCRMNWTGGHRAAEDRTDHWPEGAL